MTIARVAQISVFLLAAGCISAQAQTAPTAPDTSPNDADAPIHLHMPGQQAGDAQDDAPIHLHMPGKQAGDEPIHLHMPVRHIAQHRKRATVAKAESAPIAEPTTSEPPPVASKPPVDIATSESPPAVPAHKHAKKQPVMNAQVTPTAAPPPVASTGTASTDEALATAVPFSFTPTPPPMRKSAPPPTRMANASPPPAQTLTPPAQNVELNRGLTRQSQIIFAPGAPDPSSDAIDAIKGLAGPLNTALTAGASRIQLIAYGGGRGDHSSDARRLSLKRALIIRQLLIDGGVPANRIDVRAMGGATDGATADRVDVFTKG